MKEIELTRGKIALVDDEDYERVALHKWHAKKGNSTYYAATNLLMPNGRYRYQSMHRFILNVPKKKGAVDHQDHNGLNNQKYNLRDCSNNENARNRVSNKRSLSKYKGLYCHKMIRPNKTYVWWVARININGKRFYIGSFPYTPEGEILAAKAYDAKAKELHGDFAYLNF